MPQVLPRCPGSGEVSLKGATRREWRGALAPTLSASSWGAWGSTLQGLGCPSSSPVLEPCWPPLASPGLKTGSDLGDQCRAKCGRCWGLSGGPGELL